MSASAEEVVEMISFARVVEAMSFTGAAAKLGVSKSVVSGRLAALEDRLRTRLLQRTTRKLALTPEGLAFYPACARLAAAADDAAATVEGAGQSPRGLLRVNAPLAFAEDYLAPPIAQYLARFSDVRVEITLNDRFVDLLDAGADVAVRVASRLDGGSLVARKLAQDHTALVAAPAYLVRRGTPAHPGELPRHDCLVYSLLKVSAEWRFREPGARAAVAAAFQPRFQAESGAMLRRAALAGMGLAVLPTFMIAPELRAGRLCRVIPSFAPARLGVFALYPQGRGVPAKTRAFVDLLVAHFRAPPWSG